MKKIVLFVLVSVLGLGFGTWKAQAWQPSGWVYSQGDYCLSWDEGRQYYLNPADTMWCWNFQSGNWSRLSENAITAGWSYFQWPYVYSLTAGGWYYLNPADPVACYEIDGQFWSALGMVVPEAGDYLSSIRRHFSVARLSDHLTTQITFAPQNGEGYRMNLGPNATFHYQNGIIIAWGRDRLGDSGKYYPTDGFYIEGYFPSPTQAVGEVWFVYSGRITSHTNFVMNFNDSGVIPVYP